MESRKTMAATLIPKPLNKVVYWGTTHELQLSSTHSQQLRSGRSLDVIVLSGLLKRFEKGEYNVCPSWQPSRVCSFAWNSSATFARSFKSELNLQASLSIQVAVSELCVTIHGGKSRMFRNSASVVHAPGRFVIPDPKQGTSSTAGIAVPSAHLLCLAKLLWGEGDKAPPRCVRRGRAPPGGFHRPSHRDGHRRGRRVLDVLSPHPRHPIRAPDARIRHWGLDSCWDHHVRPRHRRLHPADALVDASSQALWPAVRVPGRRLGGALTGALVGWRPRVAPALPRMGSTNLRWSGPRERRKHRERMVSESQTAPRRVEWSGKIGLARPLGQRRARDRARLDDPT